MTPNLGASEQSQAQPLAVSPPHSGGMLLPASSALQGSRGESIAGKQPSPAEHPCHPITPLQLKQFTGGVPDPSSAQTPQKGTSPLVLVLPRPQQV